MKTEGEASYRKPPEEANGEGDPPQLADDTESTQEIQELPERAERNRGTATCGETKRPPSCARLKDQLREAEKQNTDLRQENTDLRQENDRLKRQLEEMGTPKETTSVDQQQIYPHSSFSGNSKDPDSDRGKDDSSACSGETPTIQHPETETAIPVNDGK